MNRKKDNPPALTSLDVARKAGVSQAAVSYVLNGTRSEHVSEPTRLKILQAAEELGYAIHPSARALRSGQSDEICCLFNAPRALVGDEINNAIQQQIFDQGSIPIVYNGPGEPNQKWFQALKQVFARRPRGVIMAHFMDMTDEIALARQMGIKHIVLLSTRAVADIPTLLFPNAEYGALAAEHLLERGHRHFGIIRPNDTKLAVMYQDRLESMSSTLHNVPGTTLAAFSLTRTLESASQFVDDWLAHSQRPTALYTFNDEHALCLLAALTDRNIRVPQDIALVGNDNIFACEFARPALTSIAPSTEGRLGQLVVEMLNRQIRGELQASDYPYTLVPCLVPRTSSQRTGSGTVLSTWEQS